MSDNYIPGAKINLVRVPTYVRFMKRSSISTYYHNKFSTISGPVFQECTGSCHENVPTPKAVSSDLRLTDGLTGLARIEIVAILVHYLPSYNTSHTMKPMAQLDWAY